MTKEEQLKIYAAYLPYKVTITLASEEYNYDGLTTILSPHYLLDWQRNKCKINLHIYDLSYLTKEELKSAGFDDHIDYLTHERDGWIEKYGFENYIKKLPYGHFKYLVSKHYNIFNLPEDQFINKATLTNK